MTFTYEESARAAAHMLSHLLGALLLFGIAIIIAVALGVTVKEHMKSRR
ncbi:MULTISPECIES: hypothetical protein [unclassified Streptomyces]|nr:hypothetical protein [Streptomyces sp. NRRL F-2747]